MICLSCGADFNKVGRNQKYCGSIKNKTGCSYQNHLLQKGYRKDGARRRSKSGESCRSKIFALRGKKCQKCGIENELASFFDIDHIIPRFVLGVPYRREPQVSEMDNLQILCPNCHRIKTITDRAGKY